MRIFGVLCLLPLAACGARGPVACGCEPVADPVCGADGRSYASACEAACAGVAVADAGACQMDGGGPGQTDGGGPRPCTSDSDCFADYGACGCGAICSNRLDPPPASPDGGCLLGCAGAPEPWNCLCHDGVCAAGTRASGSACDPARVDCMPGAMCCATCCGIPVPDGGAGDPAYQCVTAGYSTTGPYCPPVP
ncbi:MAG TPA: Kazal-type serine protease inhibitor domain-containing protein [Polyangia bacterium]|jgi:hypothetical protein